MSPTFRCWVEQEQPGRETEKDQNLEGVGMAGAQGRECFKEEEVATVLSMQSSQER